MKGMLKVRIQGFFTGEKNHIRKLTCVTFTFFVMGIAAGAIYCVLLKSDADTSLSSYFEKYFAGIQDLSNRSMILKNSLLSYLRMFLMIFAAAFFRPGIIVSLCTVTVKGFTSGFTTASAIKYYGIKGLLVPASSFISLLLYLPALLILASGSINCSQTHYMGEKRNLRLFLTLAICCLTIFCAAAFSDAFITTTFMRFSSRLFAN